ncbi:MAG: hypothetical protein ACLR2M_06665 [Varibaculum sp.]
MALLLEQLTYPMFLRRWWLCVAAADCKIPDIAPVLRTVSPHRCAADRGVCVVTAACAVGAWCRARVDVVGAILTINLAISVGIAPMAIRGVDDGLALLLARR